MLINDLIMQGCEVLANKSGFVSLTHSIVSHPVHSVIYESAHIIYKPLVFEFLYQRVYMPKSDLLCHSLQFECSLYEQSQYLRFGHRLLHFDAPH